MANFDFKEILRCVYCGVPVHRAFTVPCSEAVFRKRKLNAIEFPHDPELKESVFIGEALTEDFTSFSLRINTFAGGARKQNAERHVRAVVHIQNKGRSSQLALDIAASRMFRLLAYCISIATLAVISVLCFQWVPGLGQMAAVLIFLLLFHLVLLYEWHHSLAYFQSTFERHCTGPCEDGTDSDSQELGNGT